MSFSLTFRETVDIIAVDGGDKVRYKVSSLPVEFRALSSTVQLCEYVKEEFDYAETVLTPLYTEKLFFRCSEI